MKPDVDATNKNQARQAQNLTMKKRLLARRDFIFASIAGLKQVCAAARPRTEMAIASPRDASLLEVLAAREVRRYLYLRTGKLLRIIRVLSLPPGFRGFVVGQASSPLLKSLIHSSGLEKTVMGLRPEQFLLKKMLGSKQEFILVGGGDPVGTLYGAYRLTEHYGIRFYLHGDVVPDRQDSLELRNIDEIGKPLFELRGLNPWGSHPFGLDPWNADDYKAIFEQLAKMRMNFLGIHCYPEGRPYAEPSVWLGLKEDFDSNGRVRWSYPSHYYNTAATGFWGPIPPKKTGEYSFGGAMLFERDDWGSDVMTGECPAPSTAEGENLIFNRTAQQFRGAFHFAHVLGIKTCVGTETPLVMPQTLEQRLRARGKQPSDPATVRQVYEAIFRRIMAAHELDYYWVWTPEGWTWKENTADELASTVADIQLAIEAAKNVNAPFRIATAGWVLGPHDDRAAFDRLLPKSLPLSALSRKIGGEPIDPAFGRVRDHQSWAIPWLEGDGNNGLAAVQLWAGRMRKDAADARTYGCTGLLGLHWRTDILAPNVAALAQAAWDQSEWNTLSTNPAPAPPGDLNRGLPVADLYSDFAQAWFGPEAAQPIAAVFTRIDGKVPMSVAGGCPSGRLTPDFRPWEEVGRAFVFVDEFEKVRPRVRGEGNLARFDYWWNTFRYHRGLAAIRCALGRFETEMKKVAGEKNAQEKKKLAARQALPAYRTLVALYGETYGYLLATVNTPGDLAMVINLENHEYFWRLVIDSTGKRLAEALGGRLPGDVCPQKKYSGTPRLIAPTLRGSVLAGEPLTLKVIYLDSQPPRELALWWRPLGKGKFRRVPASHVARGVHKVTLPPHKNDNCVEYYLRAVARNGSALVFPPTAPRLNQTVVIVPSR